MKLNIVNLDEDFPIEKELLNEALIIKDLNLPIKIFRTIRMFSTIIMLAYMLITIAAMGGIPGNINSMTDVLPIVLPVIILIFLWITFSLTMRRASENLNEVKAGNYQLIEDIVTNKFVETSRDSDGDTHRSYHVSGYRCGKAAPSLDNSIIWDRTKIGDVIWIQKRNTKKGEHFINTYSSASYDLDPSLYAHIKALTDEERSDAEKMVQRSLDKESEKTYSKTKDTAKIFTVVRGNPSEKANVKKMEPRRTVVCISCGRRFDADKNGGTCPKCGAMQVY